MVFSLQEKHDFSHKMQSLQCLSQIKNWLYDVLFDDKKYIKLNYLP